MVKTTPREQNKGKQMKRKKITIVLIFLIILMTAAMVITLRAYAMDDEETEYPKIVLEIIEDDNVYALGSDNEDYKDMFIDLYKALSEKINNETDEEQLKVSLYDFEEMLEEIKELKEKETEIIIILFCVVIGLIASVAFLTAWKGV